MSSYLEPSFLLELGAYAVAIAGIRIFKSRYWGTGAQSSADVTPYPEKHVAPGQAAPPTVLGLGQASPLRTPPSPRRSASPALQTEPQLGASVAPPPLHEEDSAVAPFPTHCCPSSTRQAAGAAAIGSAIGFEMGAAGPNADGDHAIADMANTWVRASTHGGTPAARGTNETVEQRRAALAAHAERQRLRRAAPTAEQRATALAASAARRRARRGDSLVSEPTSAAPGMQGKPYTTATSQHDKQPAYESSATAPEGWPTFKVVCVGDGGSTKVCGADLVAWAQSGAAGRSTVGAGAEPAEDGSQHKAEATKQVQKESNEEGIDAMCESSDEEESVCAGISKEDLPLGFNLHATHAMVPSSSTGALHDSSAVGLVMDGSESDGELQPAEEAVVTHRDILLRAAQRRKRDRGNTDCFMSDTGLSYMTDSRKKPCGDHAAGHTQAGCTETKRQSSYDTSCMPGSDGGTQQLPSELPSACILPKDRQPTPRGGNVTPPGVDQEPSRGPDSTPASSDCQPQPQEEGQDQCLVSSRAMAPRPEGFLPIAGSVFDEALSPETAAGVDNTPTPKQAFMFDDSPLIQAEEEEHRHASPEQPVEAIQDVFACEEEQGRSQQQEPDQATADEIGRPNDASPAPPTGAAEEEQLADQQSLHDCPSRGEVVEAASARDRLCQDEGRYWRSRAKSCQPFYSHEPDFSCSGYDHGPNAEPAADTDHPDEHDPADPDERKHMSRSGRMTEDQCTWEPMSHSKHDSSEHHALADGPREEDWACVLPRFDSAPPVTPDSPDDSSAPPNSPRWVLSGDAWGSPSRTDTDSRPQAAWDSPPGAAPNSPDLASPRACSGRSRRHMAPRAMSSSPASRTSSPYKAPWHTPPRSQATTPMHESTPPSEGDPYAGDVVGGLDGDCAYASYAYAPPPPTPTSPSPPPSSPRHQSDTLPYEDCCDETCWRPRAQASRGLALEPSPASPESPPHCEGPAGAAPGSPALVAPGDTRHHGEEEEEEGHDQEAAVAPIPYSQIEAWPEGAFTTAADKPQHDSSSPAKEGARATKQAMGGSSKHPSAIYQRQVHWPEPFTSGPEAQNGEADPEGLGSKQGQRQGEREGLPFTSRLLSPLGRAGKGQAGVQGAGSISAELMSPSHHPHSYPPHTQADGGHLVDVCEDDGHISQVTGKLESFLEGAAAASSPEPVPGIQQVGEEEELPEESAGDRQGFEQGRSASFSPQPSPEHPLQSSLQPSSESVESFGESPRYQPRKVQEARGRHFDHDAGTPAASDKDEQEAAAVGDNPSGDQAGNATNNGLQGSSNLGQIFQRLETLLAGYGRQGTTAATSPETVDLLQAEEEEQADGPGGGQGHEQDRPSAASSPQLEEPEMMVEDSEREECYEDEEVQFVSETGPDPARSAFASAAKRFEADDEDIELLPGVQDLISGVLGSKQARHSRLSMVDDEDDMSSDKSRGRGPIRRKRGRHTSPEASRSSPSQCGRQSFGRRHGKHSHSHEQHWLFSEEDEDVSPGRPVSVCAATVSAAAGSHGAGAAASAIGSYVRRVTESHAARLRNMLCVAEEEDEEDDIDADMTCWRKLLKKS